MSDAPNDHNLPASQAGEAFIEQEGYRIPCSEATYDNEGGLIIPHPVPAHWDPDFEVLNPLPWLWKRARVSVENFTMAHGSLMEMVKDVVLERQPYEQARDWLYHIELLLRRLLLVAAWFHVGAFAPPRRGAQPRINPRRRTTPLGKHLVNACFRVPLFAREPRAPRKLRPLAQKPPAWAQLPSLTPSGAKRPREPRHGWIKLAGRQIRQERRLAALDRPAAQPPRLISCRCRSPCAGAPVSK